MKLSFSTLGCPDWSFEQAVSFAENYGFGGIELRGVDGEVHPLKIARLLPGRQQETLRMVKKAGLQLPVFGSSVSFHNPDARQAMLEEGKASVDICAAMGIPFVRVFGDSVGTENEDAVIERIASGYRELCDYAAGTGVSILQEVHGEFNILERLQKMIYSVSRDNFGLVWDVAHSCRAYGKEFLPFYQALRPWIRHVHLKDFRFTQDGIKLCMTGEGDVPLKEIVNTLKSDGYDGWFSFEWEKRWIPELAEPEIAFPAYADYMKQFFD